MYKTILIVALLAIAFTQPSGDEAQAQQAEISMKRTACLVLSRYHSNTQKESIEGVVSELAPEQQQKFINKMYAMAIEHCLPKITMDEAQQVILIIFSSLWKILILHPKKCSIFSMISSTPMWLTTSTLSLRIKKPSLNS